MKIGVWCDYGFTLEPSEGIGVFVNNLVRGLVQADSNCQITLVPHPGSSDVLSPLASYAPNQIHIAERGKPSSLRRRCIRTLTKLKWHCQPEDVQQQDLQSNCGRMLATAFDRCFSVVESKPAAGDKEHHRWLRYLVATLRGIGPNV